MLSYSGAVYKEFQRKINVYSFLISLYYDRISLFFVSVLG
jgi:hypothetical protein